MSKRERLAALALKFAIIRVISGNSIASIRLSEGDGGWAVSDSARENWLAVRYIPRYIPTNPAAVLLMAPRERFA